MIDKKTEELTKISVDISGGKLYPRHKGLSRDLTSPPRRILKAVNKLSLYYHDDEFFKKVEKDAKDAFADRSLDGEIKLLKATTLELLKKFRSDDAIGRFDETGAPIPMSDVEKTKAICLLTKAISELEKSEQLLHKDDVITLGAFQIWIASLARQIKIHFPNVEDQNIFIKIMRIIGTPQKGV